MSLPLEIQQHLYENDLELADAFNKLFFEVVLPTLVIAGYFITSKANRAVVVNNFQYRFLEEKNKKDKSKERWLCMWTSGKKNVARH